MSSTRYTTTSPQRHRQLGGRRLLVVDIDLRVRSGENGADLELLDVIEREGIEHRFDELALVSGDGIFTDAVARLGACGVKVTVAAWPESLSKCLRLAASKIVYLTDGHATATRRVAR